MCRVHCMFVLLQGDTARRKNFVYHLELSISMTGKNKGGKQKQASEQTTHPAFTNNLLQCENGRRIILQYTLRDNDPWVK